MGFAPRASTCDGDYVSGPKFNKHKGLDDMQDRRSEATIGGHGNAKERPLYIGNVHRRLGMA